MAKETKTGLGWGNMNGISSVLGCASVRSHDLSVVHNFAYNCTVGLGKHHSHDSHCHTYVCTCISTISHRSIVSDVSYPCIPDHTGNNTAICRSI